MLVSVIIPARNEADHIKQCIQSIYKNKSKDIDIEIIIVDGMSNDNTDKEVISLLSEGMPIQILKNEKKITPIGMNIGLEKCKGDYLLFSGAHAFFPSDYIGKCLDSLNRKTEVWCAGGSIRTISESYWGRVIAAAMSSPFGVGNAKFRMLTSSGYVDTLAFGLYPRWVFDRIGKFDECLIRNQDDDFNYRIIKAGGKIYLDSKIVSTYYGRSSILKLIRQYYQYGFWRVKTIIKHHSISSIRQIIPAIFILCIVLGGVLSCFSNLIAFLYLIFLFIYVLFLMVGTVDVAKNSGLNIAISAPLIFVVLHCSYGIGFWSGVFAYSTRHEIIDKNVQISR